MTAIRALGRRPDLHLSPFISSEGYCCTISTRYHAMIKMSYKQRRTEKAATSCQGTPYSAAGMCHPKRASPSLCKRRALSLKQHGAVTPSTSLSLERPTTSDGVRSGSKYVPSPNLCSKQPTSPRQSQLGRIRSRVPHQELRMDSTSLQKHWSSCFSRQALNK